MNFIRSQSYSHFVAITSNKGCHFCAHYTEDDTSEPVLGMYTVCTDVQVSNTSEIMENLIQNLLIA